MQQGPVAWDPKPNKYYLLTPFNNKRTFIISRRYTNISILDDDFLREYFRAYDLWGPTSNLYAALSPFYNLYILEYLYMWSQQIIPDSASVIFVKKPSWVLKLLMILGIPHLQKHLAQLFNQLTYMCHFYF
ncbi:hypothetical protein ACJX0J_039188 [Zea mays]